MKDQISTLTAEQALRACERIMNLNRSDMQVICTKKPMGSSSGEPCPSPEVGDKDIVTEEVIRYDTLFYRLERFGDKLAYAAKCFSMLNTDLDETELVTEEFEEKYCVPVNQTA